MNSPGRRTRMGLEAEGKGITKQTLPAAMAIRNQQALTVATESLDRSARIVGPGSSKSTEERVILFDKYELGRLLGAGSFSKVYYAREIRTGKGVAIKTMSKQKIMMGGLAVLVKREISIMRRLRHPNIVRLYEVLASKTKIYFVIEYVRGGELFAKIERNRRLKEDSARRYFQQIISAVLFCHARGVIHRDLKPENILLDEFGNVKITDFGLSALTDQLRHDGLFHTFCGTPAYVAPEILSNKGYDGFKIDIWSCGVILFVLTAGYLPFDDPNLMVMFRKIAKGEFKCPKWMSPELCNLLNRLLDTNPETRISGDEITKDPWFSKGGYKGTEYTYALEDDDGWWSKNDGPDPSAPSTSSPDQKLSPPMPRPASLNAFDIISFSQGVDLSGLFEPDKEKLPTSPMKERFISGEPVSRIIDRLEELAKVVSFTVKKKNSKVQLEGPNGELAVGAEIFRLTDALLLVEVKKRGGDVRAYDHFYKSKLRPALHEIAYQSQPALSDAD